MPICIKRPKDPEALAYLENEEFINEEYAKRFPAKLFSDHGAWGFKLRQEDLEQQDIDVHAFIPGSQRLPCPS